MNSFISYPEMQLILCKDNANRMQYKPNLFGFIAEMQLILCKNNEYQAKKQAFIKQNDNGDNKRQTK